MSFSVKNYFNKDLRYKSPVLEREYSESKRRYQTSFLYIVLCFGLSVGIIGWAVNPNNAPNFEVTRFGFRVALIILLFIFAMLAWKRPHLSEKLVVVLILFYFFGLMETSIKNKQYWNNDMFFLTGINIEFILICSILAKISWKATCFLSILINVMNCFRYTELSEYYENHYYPLIHFIQNTILISASAYIFEKYDRESFYKYKSYEFYLSQFKDLIKNMFPCAVIITSGENIIFNNKESLDMFGSKSAEEVWEKLEKITLERPAVDAPKEKSNIIPIFEEALESNNLFRKQSITLLDVVTSFGKSQRRAHEDFYGEYEQIGCPKALNVKIMEINWENKDSLIVIITENHVVQKMELMREHAIYKNRILATVSHDLRTPLSGIIGMINMTLEMTLDPMIKKYLKIVHRSSRSLLFMINDILDYTSLSTGRGITLNRERFSLWDIILEVSELFKFQLKMKGINFQKRNYIVTNKYRAFIINDKARVKQVLFNLLANAMKYTVFGSIKVSLKELTPLAYEIAVEDTGFGVKKENQHNIFKLFGKLQDSENEDIDQPRIGLGLPLSQSLVKILNNNKKEGVIKLESEFQKGSRFSFLIYHEGTTSYEEIQNENPSTENSKKFYNAPTMEKFILILIVDANSSNIESIVKTLKSFCEFVFDEAANGEDALRLMKIRASSSLYYNLILVDCEIDSFTGIQVMNTTRSMILREEIPAVPVVGISSNLSPGFHSRSLELGMADNITKPLTNEMMKARLEKYLN